MLRTVNFSISLELGAGVLGGISKVKGSSHWCLSTEAMALYWGGTPDMKLKFLNYILLWTIKSWKISTTYLFDQLKPGTQFISQGKRCK